MTKIEHTKTHTVERYLPDTLQQAVKSKVESQALVTDAKLVLVKLDKRTDEYQHWLKSYKINKGDGELYKPILISETEKIEVGEQYSMGAFTGWKIETRVETDYGAFEPKYKILALPEHFSSQQLQDIVDGKLKDGDKVLVECVTDYDLLEPSDFNPNTGKCFIKLNPHITIYPVEEKMVPISKVLKAFEEANILKINGLFPEEWFEQNVK